MAALAALHDLPANYCAFKIVVASRQLIVKEPIMACLLSTCFTIFSLKNKYIWGTIFERTVYIRDGETVLQFMIFVVHSSWKVTDRGSLEAFVECLSNFPLVQLPSVSKVNGWLELS